MLKSAFEAFSGRFQANSPPVPAQPPRQVNTRGSERTQKLHAYRRNNPPSAGVLQLCDSNVLIPGVLLVFCAFGRAFFRKNCLQTHACHFRRLKISGYHPVFCGKCCDVKSWFHIVKSCGAAHKKNISQTER